jgi:PKD repeat protein
MKNEKLKMKAMKAMKIMIVRLVHRSPCTLYRVPFTLHCFLFALCLLLFQACHYDEIAPIEYADGLLYLPAAFNGTYSIDELTKIPLTPNPTPGYACRYTLDKEANLFEIPLSVYRGGVEPGGAIAVEITVNNDTINKLIEEEMLPDTVKILPADKYALENKLNMTAGQRTAPFTLSIPFDFLVNAAPDVYVLAIGISSEGQASNPLLNTVVVLIDTRIMKSAPDFDFEIDKNNGKKVSFTNNSAHALSFAWNFGDGQTSKENNPVHTYENAGDYDVVLTTIGLNDAEITCTKRVRIN